MKKEPPYKIIRINWDFRRNLVSRKPSQELIRHTTPLKGSTPDLSRKQWTVNTEMAGNTSTHHLLRVVCTVDRQVDDSELVLGPSVLLSHLLLIQPAVLPVYPPVHLSFPDGKSWFGLSLHLDSETVTPAALGVVPF